MGETSPLRPLLVSLHMSETLPLRPKSSPVVRQCIAGHLDQIALATSCPCADFFFPVGRVALATSRPCVDFFFPDAPSTTGKIVSFQTTDGPKMISKRSAQQPGTYVDQEYTMGAEIAMYT